MCKFKDYTVNIENQRRSLIFRATFFSKPNFLDKFISSRSEVLGSSFVVRQLTEKEGEDVVDVDKIASLLSIPLDYILKDKRTYIFYRDIEDSKIRFFISQYYVLVQIQSQKIDLNVFNLADILKLEDFVPFLDIIDISMVDDYYVGCGQEELWHTLDRAAFGDLDVDSVIESRYADTHQRGMFDADLVRRIFKRETVENDIMCQVFVKSIVSLVEVKQENIKKMEELLSEMKDCSEKEVTRCFSEEFVK